MHAREETLNWPVGFLHGSGAPAFDRMNQGSGNPFGNHGDGFLGTPFVPTEAFIEQELARELRARLAAEEQQERGAHEEAQARLVHDEQRAAESSGPELVPDPMTTMLQLLQAQSARQDLLLQHLLTRLNQVESQQQSPQALRGVTPPPPPRTGGPPGLSPGWEPSDSLGAAGKMLDSKWIPPMPAAAWSSWKGRVEEIVGFWSWADTFSSWLALVHPAFPQEIREMLTRSHPLQDHEMSVEQGQRSQRLYHLLRQTFQGCSRVQNLVQVFNATRGIGNTNGFELMRLIRLEFSIRTRSEALHFRDEVIRFKVVTYESLPDLIRQVDAKVYQFQQLLATFPEARLVSDVVIQESDMYLLLLRNLPEQCRHFVQLHCGDTVAEVRKAIEVYHTRTELMGDFNLHAISSGPGRRKRTGKGAHAPPGKGTEKGKAENDKGKGKFSYESPKGKKGGKGDGKGKGSSSRSSSVDKEKAKKEGLCFECGASDHQAKDCPNKKARRKGTVTCHRCGKPGHFQKDCRVKLRHVHSGEELPNEEEQDEIANEGKVFMVWRHEEQRKPLQTCLRGHSSTDPRSRSHVEQSEHLVSHVVLKAGASSLAWLVDSGATSHIISRSHLSKYNISHSHDGLNCELRAANHQVIPTFGMKDVDVVFACIVRGRKTTRTFTLRKCIVADTDVSVISPFVLSSNGWSCLFSADGNAAMTLGDLSVPMMLEERAWWARPVFRTARTKPGLRTPVEMEVDGAFTQSETDNSTQRAHTECTCEACVDLSTLKEAPNPSSVGTALGKESEKGISTFEVGRLSFLYRSLEAESGECHRFGMFFSDESVRVEVGLSDRDVEPRRDEEMGGEECDGEIEEVALEGDPLYKHIAQGHVPHVSSCESCSRAAGRIPARRLKFGRSRCCLGADYGYFGKVRFLCVVVYATGMLLASVMTADSDRNARTLNQMLRELGVTGKNIELVSDGESGIFSLFRAAGRLNTSPVIGTQFTPAPPGRSQSNGRAERAIGIIKERTAANILFLEGRLGRRIPLESPIVEYLLPYVSRCLNVFNVETNSLSTPFDKLRGKVEGKRPLVLPFGSLCFAKLHNRVHELERFAKIVYLGNKLTSGGGVLGILAAESRIGLEEDDWKRVRVFQVAKLITPCEWSRESMEVLLAHVPDGLLPPPLDEGPVGLGIPEGESQGIEEPFVGPSPVVVPPSGPPRLWLDRHGLTPNCYGCNGIRQNGTAKGRHHSPLCKKRYREWLEQEAQKDRSEKVPPHQDAPSIPPSVPPFPISVSDPRHPTGGQRFTGKRPPAALGEGEEVGQDPNGPADMEYEPSIASAPVPMSDLDEDEMDVGVIAHRMLVEQENGILRGAQDFGSRQAEEVWFESKCLGIQIWQSRPKNPVCEISHAPMDIEDVETAFRTEHTQLTNLDTGTWVTETQAKDIASKTRTKVMPTRWVVVQKPDKVRCRIVCKDFRSSGLSSLREDIYAPTGSLEALRVLLCIAQVWCLSLFSLDISTAFLYAPLGKGETQVVVFPPSTIGSNGQRLYLLLKKALYGLRRAPLAWFREIRSALLSFGLECTAETTVFRYSKRDSFLLCLVYVDDLLLTGREEDCLWLIGLLEEKYMTKRTGALGKHEVGSISFLGRVIARKHLHGPLSLGLHPTYFDSIEAASGVSLKATWTPPNLSRFTVGDEKDQALDAEGAKRYRAVLGRLAWFSLTVPLLAYHVSWCASFQSAATVLAEKGLRETLRFAKSFRCFVQVFGAEGPSFWNDSASELHVITDASWGLKSYMGGIIIWQGSLIRSWSRKIQTTCLSSAESEMHGIAEGAREGLGTACLIDTLVKGLPPRDPIKGYVKLTSDLPIILHTDSESGLHIGQMAGLLRRVKHLELRALFVQELVDSGRMSLVFEPGETNPSDFLTKPSDSNHLSHIIFAMGLEHMGQEVIGDVVDAFLANLHLSGQNRRKLQEGIEYGLRHLKQAQVQRQTPCESKGGDTASCDLSENENYETPIASAKSVHFQVDVEIISVPNRFDDVEYLCGYRSIPPRWRTALRQFGEVGKQLEPGLIRFCKGYPLVLEVCCKADSDLAQACKCYSLAHVALTREIDVGRPATIALVRLILSKGGWVLVHLNTPSTAGWRVRGRGPHVSSSLVTWKARLEEHRRIWRGIDSMLGEYASRPELILTQQWPQSCGLWEDVVYTKVSKKLRLTYTCLVDRSSLDDCQEIWQFASNCQKMTCLLEIGGGSKAPKVTGPWSFTKGQSPQMAEHMLACFVKCKGPGSAR